jgi:hypothetical protein
MIVATIRVPKALMAEIDAIVAKRSLEGVSQSTVIRELLVYAIKAKRGQK